MKKIYALMASAAMFSLIACSADGVMDKSDDADGSGRETIASRAVAEAEAQRAANTPKSADGCFVSTTSSQLKFEMSYLGVSESIIVQDNGNYAFISVKAGNVGDFSDFCESFTEDYDVSYNAQCNASTGEASFNVPYEDGIEFEDAAESFQELCDELNKTIAEETEKAKDAEEKNNSSTNQQTSGDDYDWDDDYDDYDDYDDSDFDWDDSDFEW